MSQQINTELQSVIEAVHGHFREYLESHDIKINSKGFFKCISHDDHNPSMSLSGTEGFKDRVAHCFSCGASVNIFHAAQILEGLPVNGAEFYSITLKTLADKYGIPYEPMALSEDEKIKYQKKAAYRDAVNVIHGFAMDHGKLKTNHIAVQHLIDRGIEEVSIKYFKIGVIYSYADYLAEMDKRGWKNREELSEYGLTNEAIFNNHSAILPIMNDVGQPVAFVARNVSYNADDPTSRKFINSSTSDIYTKGGILYNYNNVKKELGPLFIVEGYLDAVYLKQMGLKKVCAIGATILTEQHVDMLIRDDVRDVVIALDPDQGGKTGVKTALDRTASFKSLTISIIDLPNDQDPDSFVRESGLQSFLDIKRKSPFQWLLANYSYDQDLTVVAQNAISIIAKDESAISRLRMIKELAQFTAIAESDIRRDVESLVNKRDDKYLEEVALINHDVQIKLNRKNVQETRKIIRDASSKLDQIEEKFNRPSDPRSDFANKLDQLENKIKGGEYTHGFLTPSFKKLENTLDGVPYWSNLMYIGGRPSAGKCLGKGTKVLMYDGTLKSVEDINNGDKLMGDDSTPRTVMGVTTGVDRMYTVSHFQGISYRVNEPHILSLKRSRNGKGLNPTTHHGDVIDIPLNEYISKSPKFQNNFKGYKVGVEFKECDLNIDPYFMGIWLGDGSSSNVTITTKDAELVNYLKEYATKLHLTLRENHPKDRCSYYSITNSRSTSTNKNSLQAMLRKENVLNNKHIPQNYLINSRKNRLSLLAGLLDTDGYLCNDRSYEFVQVNENIALQVKFLADSLGFRTSIVKKDSRIIKPDYVFHGFAYRLSICGNIWEIPVKISRKKASIKKRRDWSMSGIKISFDKIDNYYGFMLDGNGRFLLEDMTVTHNTALLTALSLDIVQANEDAAVFYMSIDDNTDLLATKILAVRSGLSTTQIKNYKELKGENQAKFDEAMSFLKSIKDRYVVADSSQGNTINHLEAHMKFFVNSYPKHKKLFLLDNFHKLNMLSNTDKKMDAISDTSSQIKLAGQLYDLSIIATVELRKLESEVSRPTRQDMQGSNKLDYDADVIALVHNDRQVNRESVFVHHDIKDDKGTQIAMPIIEVNVCKNKINGKDGYIGYKFNTVSMNMSEMSGEQYGSIINEKKKRQVHGMISRND